MVRPPSRPLLALGLGIGIAGQACRGERADDHVYTLYRTSVVNDSMRVHVATFDAAGGEIYNRDSCEYTRALYQDQPRIKTRFFCEKGRYRK